MASLKDFSSLPKEIQLKIFSFLPHKLLFSLKTLNKSYNELITNTGFQTNIIFNSMNDMKKDLQNTILNFIKISTESPLDTSYCYLSIRDNLENVIVLHSELIERTVEGIGKKMNIYLKCKAKILDNNSETIEYSSLKNNKEMQGLVSRIKNCQKVIVREKDVEEPTVDNIPGNPVLTLFSVDPLYSNTRNGPPLYTTSIMKNILLEKNKSLPILYGFLEAGMVLEYYCLDFPIIETFEFITSLNDNSKKMKRCIRLDPLQQMKSYHLNNVKLIEYNKKDIQALEDFIKQIFNYFNN